MAPVPVAIAVGIAMILTGLTLLIVLLMKLTDWRIEGYAAEDRYRYTHMISKPTLDDVEVITTTLRRQIEQVRQELHALPTLVFYNVEDHNATSNWATQQIPLRARLLQYPQEVSWR